MSTEKTDGSNLVAVSINLLYDGMEIQEDIYDADATLLLIKNGATLDEEMIGRIKNINSGRETIHVSGNTYKNLLTRIPPVEVESLSELEEITGYSTATDATFKLLDELSSEQVLDQEALSAVSNELSARLESTSPSKVLSLINALAPVDEYLQRHCVDVSLLNGLFGRWLGLPRADVDRLVMIGLLHDCGKARIPPQVLNAPRKLTAVEFEVIKMHAVYSYDLLEGFPEQVRLAARGHHEKVSGLGYPDRLSPANILMDARITAVSDIYDAMVSQRAYKRPRSPFNIMAEIVKLRNLELDSMLVDIFIANMPKELMDKQVMMSDGTIGIVRSFDPEDIEFPMVEVDSRVIRSDSNWYCTSMYTKD